MSNSKTRREFLITAGTGVAVGLLSPSLSPLLAQAGPALRVRKNVMSTAAQRDLASLKKGVDEMKKLFKANQNDPRGWVKQAFLHGNCTRFTYCQHGNWYFPPWHRSYIYYFEQLIQFFSGDSSFALPYWDWSRTISVPGSFYGAGNPLDDDISLKTPPPPIPTICSNAPTAGRGVAQGTQITPSELDTYCGPRRINIIQSDPDYATYGGSEFGAGMLESTPHNFIHRWVGGAASGSRKISNMVQTFSPMDPIFWLHHCNIDRLYSNWLARGYQPPTDPAWTGKSFDDFYDKDKNKVGKEFTAGMTVDSKVMGYVYDTLLAMPKALTVEKRGTGKAEVEGSVSASKSTAKAGVLSFVTEAAPSTQTRQFLNAAAVGTADQVVRLIIHGVKKPKKQSTGVHVFIGPHITAHTPITAPGYVGSFTFFQSAFDDSEHHHERTVLFNATEALRSLYGDTNLPEGVPLQVSIVTGPLGPGVESFATVEEVRPDRIQIEVVNLNA